MCANKKIREYVILASLVSTILEECFAGQEERFPGRLKYIKP